MLKPYEASVEHEHGRPLGFNRRGKIEGQGELSIQKIVSLEASSHDIMVRYNIKNEGNKSLSFRFGVESNFAFLAGYASDRYYHIPDRKIEEPHLAGKGQEEEVTEISIFDEWRNFNMSLRFSLPARLWRFPVETISQSEAGLERVYQQSVLVPNWEVDLQPQASSSLEIKLSINS